MQNTAYQVCYYLLIEFFQAPCFMPFHSIIMKIIWFRGQDASETIYNSGLFKVSTSGEELAYFWAIVGTGLLLEYRRISWLIYFVSISNEDLNALHFACWTAPAPVGHEYFLCQHSAHQSTKAALMKDSSCSKLTSG